MSRPKLIAPEEIGILMFSYFVGLNKTQNADYMKRLKKLCVTQK